MAFMESFENAVDREENLTETENGARGYKSTKNPLLDLSFKVPTLRREALSVNLYDKYIKEAMEFDKIHTLKWLLYLRDIRGGLGERSSFRNILHFMNEDDPATAELLLQCNLTDYCRWDDIIETLVSAKASSDIRKIAFYMIKNQLTQDIHNALRNDPVSLLGKWLPSINASSKRTRHAAIILCDMLHMSYKEYRKTLSILRRAIDVVEKKMSANEWDDINFEKLPSRAQLQYREAFEYHDQERYRAYLKSVKNNEAKMNAKDLMPYDIIHRYSEENTDVYKYYGYGQEIEKLSESLELLWKNLPAPKKGLENILPVIDVSGSMYDQIGFNSSVFAVDVSISLGIYCAEHNTKEEFKNKFVTFSSSPAFVKLDGDSLMDNINKVIHKDNMGYSTDIEKVFDLILDTAVKNKLSQEDLPSGVLIISDMEFDQARDNSYYYSENNQILDNDTLMETISKKYHKYGYDFPKLIFWNVNSRSNTLPILENKNGLTLVAGFSTSILEMVNSGELDPYKALLKILDTPRYDVINKVFDK